MDETNGGGGQPVFLVLILIYSLYLFFSHTLLFFILISLPLPIFQPFLFFCTHRLWLFFCTCTTFALQQSLSAPPAQALSCMESLCCYQQGQSGCSRLASLLDQMTGHCKAGASNCHTSSRCNRWAGHQGAMIMDLHESPGSFGVVN